MNGLTIMNKNLQDFLDYKQECNLKREKMLEHKNSENFLDTKDQLAQIIKSIVKKSGFTQAEASQIMKISQPKVSEIFNGHLELYSVDRLLTFINRLGYDVEISILESKYPSGKIFVKGFDNE